MKLQGGIFGKSLLIVGIPALAQLIFLAVMGLGRADQSSAQFWSAHSAEVMAKSARARLLLAEARGALRGFLLTNDVSFAKHFENGRTEASVALTELVGLVQDNSAQLAMAKKLRASTEDLMLAMDSVEAMQAAGKPAEAAAQLRKLETDPRFDQVETQAKEFADEEKRLDGIRKDDVRRLSHRLDWMLIGGAVLVLASTVGLLYGVSQRIGWRLAEVAANVRRFGAGQEMKPIRDVSDEIGQLDRAFHDMAIAIGQKDRENEMFVYSVSHDLRGPLVNLQGFSQELARVCDELRELLKEKEVPVALRERVLPLLDGRAARSIQFIQTAVSRLAAIIDALLRLSRVGRVEYHKKVVDVDSIVRRVVESLRDSIGQRAAEVTVGPMSPAWADPTAVDQVFANLLQNAVNYLDPKRPGKIEVSCPQNPAAGARPGFVVYCVTDNGLGIAPEFHEKIFLAFQRLHPRAAPGEGIGLALVRRVMERHGGKVWLESTPGVGSTFCVAFPAPATEKQEANS